MIPCKQCGRVHEIEPFGCQRCQEVINQESKERYLVDTARACRRDDSVYSRMLQYLIGYEYYIKGKKDE